MTLEFDIDMTDISAIKNNIIFNNSGKKDEVRGHSLIPSVHSSRSTLIYLDTSNEQYSDRMQRESDNIVKDDPVAPSDSPQLEHTTFKGKRAWVSKTANTSSNMRKQQEQNEAPVLTNNTMDNNSNVFNVQLNYDINQALNLEVWDSNFRTISIHGSIEHITSDIKNINKSLERVQRYILGKGIKGNKANEIKNLEEFGKGAWRFILALYESY